MMNFFPLVLLSFLGAHSTAASGGTCACEAEELGYKIDCSDQAAMLDALQLLKSSGCTTNCSSEECEKNYYIVQAHHDFCPEDGIPEDIEDDFHDYNETCVSCEITRSFTEGAPDCPAPNCDNNSGNAAYVALVDTGCSTDCSSNACRDFFFVLRVVHDLCPHDTLSRASEEGLHDMEISCANQICNVSGDAAKDQLVCSDDHGDSHDSHGSHGSHDSHDEADEKDSAAVAAATTGAVALIGSILLVL